MKRTKIVATIGPASENIKTIKQMMRGGLNVCRLNFSHNVHSHHRMLIRNIRRAAQDLNHNVAIIQDLQGPRIRIGDLGSREVKIKKGQEVIFFYSEKRYIQSKPVAIPIHYVGLYRDLKPGHTILVSDGLIKLRVIKISGQKIYCETVIGGTIKSHKGMNFPDSKIKADPLTRKDLKDLEFGIKNQVDYVAISFVRDYKDINNLRRIILALEKKYNKSPRVIKKKILKKLTTQTKIIAKIERREAVDNFDKILSVADAVMVARGDLGIELPFEDVPMIQKNIIGKCNYTGKPVIVATQMLESMTSNPLPTRAETSDVANAILDGTDAIMLSGESATGQYPVQAVKAMNRIAREIEPVEFKLQQELELKLKRTKSVVDFAAYNAQDMAEKLKAKKIICLTTSGYMARMVSRYKSKVPLIVLTPNKITCRQLALVWGVKAYEFKLAKPYHQLSNGIFNFLKKNKEIKKGQSAVICAGQSLGIFRQNNLVKIEEF